ncbi:MAG: diacylglycerol kinase family protein [Vicingaceae bacterium]
MKDRLASFRYAIAGLKTLYKEEHNARIHLFATFCAILLAIQTKISAEEWLILLLVIAVVWICELFNTALENLCDKVAPENNPTIKKVKDLSAAAVLVSSILALIVGGILFLPPLIYSIKQLL